MYIRNLFASVLPLLVFNGTRCSRLALLGRVCHDPALSLFPSPLAALAWAAEKWTEFIISIFTCSDI
jgi:hypothetical protein